MKKLLLAALVFSCAFSVQASSTVADVVSPVPTHTVTVSKAGDQGWTMMTSVAKLGPLDDGKVTFATGGTFVAKNRFGHARQLTSVDYLAGCAAGKPTTANYTTGAMIAIVDDQLFVTESKLVRMERLQLGECTAFQPVLSLETWSRALSDGSRVGQEQVAAPAGFNVVVERIQQQ